MQNDYKNNTVGGLMKFFVFGNNEKDINYLIKELSNYYRINSFTTTNLDEVNEVVKKNKSFIIKSSNNYEELCNLSEIIIYLDYSKKNVINEKINILLKKHIRKGIIIKSKKDLKKYLKSVYESDRYII